MRYRAKTKRNRLLLILSLVLCVGMTCLFSACGRTEAPAQQVSTAHTAPMEWSGSEGYQISNSSEYVLSIAYVGYETKPNGEGPDYSHFYISQGKKQIWEGDVNEECIVSVILDQPGTYHVKGVFEKGYYDSDVTVEVEEDTHFYVVSCGAYIKKTSYIGRFFQGLFSKK